MKTNINKVELVGFAGMDAEVRNIKDNMQQASFSLATSESFKNKNGEWVNTTTWHRIVLWNENAKKAAELVKKGARVSLSGKLNYRTYETDKGEKRLIVEIVANALEVLPKVNA